MEEAPAPFLSGDLDAQPRAASTAILREAGYAGAATCEFLLGQDGTLAFLEALRRARRALHEFEVAGMTASLPFHRRLVTDEAFAPPDPGRPFSIHTGWIESKYPASVLPDP